MRIKIFEGSVAEFVAVEHHFFAPQPLTTTVDGDETAVTVREVDSLNPDGESPLASTTSVPSTGLTEAAAKEFFTRRPLSSEQTAIVRAVFESGERGTTTPEIAAVARTKPASVKAQMRLLGKRVAHTTGWPKALPVFRKSWENHQNRYWLHEEMRAVIASGRVKL